MLQGTLTPVLAGGLGTMRPLRRARRSPPERGGRPSPGGEPTPDLTSRVGPGHAWTPRRCRPCTAFDLADPLPPRPGSVGSRLPGRRRPSPATALPDGGGRARARDRGPAIAGRAPVAGRGPRHHTAGLRDALAGDRGAREGSEYGSQLSGRLEGNVLPALGHRKVRVLRRGHVKAFLVHKRSRGYAKTR